ncbi:hypothetical protein LSH36_24g12144 [Paralvinella palmiformis]|uniref:Coiled-coil domain-containing protein 149 n=1 Tax=Paralvinella palmiformis TaxID=53620 RepID=A0AAD9KB20_9ANNE|nr:hypothetical protein LSH36_24g12144 [Paralvinella palmiformis]
MPRHTSASRFEATREEAQTSFQSVHDPISLPGKLATPCISWLQDSISCRNQPAQLLLKGYSQTKLRNRYAICRCKLDSKCEALLILSKDLDVCRQERDQFKLMAEQVQARYQGLKRQLAGVGPRQMSLDGAEFSGMKQQSLAHLLCEMREVNKAQQFEIDSLKQKLVDAQGDIKLLREQIARHRVGTTDEGINTRHFPAHEREDLVKQLEEAREQYLQIERDLQQVLDEKEELVTERDVYRNKYDRLNSELNLILRGDEKHLVDIDALSMENKYLQERIKQIEEEKTMAMATVSKYKSILERKKNKGIIRLGQARSGGVVISQKQVQQLLENKSLLTPTPKMMADLQALATALLEALNDKSMALGHQRKTNKILGLHVAELEKKLKTFEVAGLWSIPEKASSLAKLRDEVQEIQTLIPKSPPLSPEGEPRKCASDILATLDSGETIANGIMPSCEQTDEQHELSHRDLDFLPTKEGATDSEKGHSGPILLGEHTEMLKSMDSTETDDSLLEDRMQEGCDDSDFGVADLSSLLEKAAIKSTGHDVKLVLDQDGENRENVLDIQKTVQ